jgi:NAD+ synthase (glutamine-hydrolysing)
MQLAPQAPSTGSVLPFRSPFAHGFVRVAACTPRVEIAEPEANLRATIELAKRADAAGAALAVFPELGLSAYSNDDLFFQDALLDGVEQALDSLRQASATLLPILVVGAPLQAEGKLFNCAVAIQGGRILCVVPKTYLPNYREFYEKRYFAPGTEALGPTIRVAGSEVPFGNDILIEAPELPGFVVHIEICEDIWVPLPPSTFAALGGATVLANLSASNVTIGKAEFRRLLAATQSGRCIAAYVYSAAGFGESTTDLAWDGHAMIHENGELLAESERFAAEPGLILADVDLDRLRQDRARTGTFGDCAAEHQGTVKALRRVTAALRLPQTETALQRRIGRFPFVPANPATLNERCAEAYAIQVQGLARRLRATGLGRMVIGISGGLDSAQAAIVCAKAADQLGLPRSHVLAYTMPGFATSERTLSQARNLMATLGFSAGEIDIRPSCEQMLHDLDHPYARGEKTYDVTFENVQAGERTSHLFRLANLHGGIVVGTSDLSELALGFTTYGVGDHMAHYAVNSSVPKTLIRHLIRWVAESEGFAPAVGEVLRAILDTAISPELVPGDNGELVQHTEQIVGPYALQDFFLYYISRFGYRPSKVAYLAEQAWADAASGAWPATVPAAERRAYDLPIITHWLRIFLRRFFATSQFKRSALPNGPKIGSGGSLSPRGDWRAPSDGNAEVWLRELAARVPGAR